MIKKVLTYCADQLNAYLSRYHHRPEGLAEVGHIGSWHFVQQNLPFDLGARNSFPQ